MNTRSLMTTGAFILFLVARVEGQEAQNAVSFLLGSQAANGSWQPASCGDVFETTAVAARALAEAGSAGSPAIERALAHLAAKDPVTPREAALRALALHAAGRDNAADLARLQGMYLQRYFPSGWGADEASEPDVLTTALAVEALMTSQSTFDMAASVDFLVAAFFSTGANLYPATFPATGQGNLFATARCLAALNVARSRYSLIDYISTRTNGGPVGVSRSLQDPSGGWGDQGPTVLETAMVLHMLKTSRVPLGAAETKGADYLKARQLSGGSWEHDPFATAWALRALAVPIDTDADGIPDAWETAYGLDPGSFFDGAADRDGDGLTNLAEYQAGSDPQKLDTDSDGVSDPDEVANHSDPASAASRNRAPSFTSAPAAIASAGAVYRYDAAAADPDGEAVVFRLVKGPTGLAIAVGGRVSWPIPGGTTGFFQIALECADPRGAKGFQAYTLTVVPGGVDLVPGTIDLAGFHADTQTLVASGTVRVEVENAGAEAFTGSFEVALFADRNGSGALEPAVDVLAGSGSFMGTIPSLGSTSLDIAASASVAFRDAPLHAFVDSLRRIPEFDETNNVGSSESASRHVGSLAGSLPVVEWTWPGEGAIDKHVWTPPVAAPLSDTTGDGVVDERDVPAVVFVVNDGQRNTLEVRAHRGDTGEALWVFTDPALTIYALKAPAVADLDADGVPEVLVHCHTTRILFALNADGTLKWKKPNDPWISALVVADLDADAFPEILSSGTTYDHEGNLLWTAPTRSGDNLLAPLPVDLDLDGDLEVVYYNAAVDHLGQPVWEWRWNGAVHDLLADGKVLETRVPPPFVHLHKNAVIQADEDPEPEIVGTNNLSYLVNALPLWCIESDGRVKWGPVPLQFAEPERGVTSHASLPAVADFDGDGAPEVVVALSTTGNPHLIPPEPGKTAVLCFDADGMPRWRWESKTGYIRTNAASQPSAYDFDGDGAFEVLVSTAHELVILSGKDGSPVWKIAADTGVELNGPIVADVDNDGGAEIVRTLTPWYPFGTGLRSGIVVLGDANDEWSNARRIWGGMRNDGINLSEVAEIPSTFAPGWYDSGSHPRQLGLDGHTPHDAPDLSVSRLRADTSACPDVVLIARVGNGGSIHAPPGVPVEFWKGDPGAGGTLIGVATTEQPLYPGEHEDVRLLWPGAPAGGALVHAWVLPQRPRPVVRASDIIGELEQRGSHVYVNGTYGDFGWGFNVLPAFDGEEGTVWDDSSWWPTGYTPHHFFEVHFTLPVDVEGLTLKNPSHPARGWRTATLTLYTDLGDFPAYEAVVSLDAKVSTIDVPDTAGVRRIRLEGDDVRGNAATLGEIQVAGSFEDPLPRTHEGRTDNNRASALLTFACGGPQPNRPPQITSAPMVAASATEPYSYQVVAEDPENRSVTYAILRAPAGMAIGASSGVLSWSPGYEHVGSHPVEVEARDPEGLTAAQRFDLSVEARINRPPRITSDPPATASGIAWSYQVTAIDPDGDSLTWLLADGPAGMALDAASGLLSWAPRPGLAASVSIRVEDGRGGSARQSFTLSSGDAGGDPPAPPADLDRDGFPAGADCDDADSTVNPGRFEVPGNGIDDDCNPATPDAAGPGDVRTILRPLSLVYTIGQTAVLLAQVSLDGAPVAYGPVEADFVLEDEVGRELSRETASLGTLLPVQILETSFDADTAGFPFGKVHATLTPRYGGTSWPPATATFEVVGAANPLEGFLAGPRQVSPGQSVTLAIRVRNVSRSGLNGVTLTVKVYQAATKTEVRSWVSAPLAIAPGAEAADAAVFSTEGLPAGGLLVGLTAETGGKTHVLATSRVDVVNRFRRGEANADGKTNISDPVFTLTYLFLGGAEPACLDALDADDNGQINITDAIHDLGYLFLGGRPPLPPGPEECGVDPTPDELGGCDYPGSACGG